MSWTHIVGESAEEDLTKIALWYDGERPGLGSEVLAEFDLVIARLKDNPFQYRVVFDDVRRALMHRVPYGVYYTVDEEKRLIDISVVADLRRRPSFIVKQTKRDG